MSERFALEVVFEGVDNLSRVTEKNRRGINKFASGLQAAGRTALVGLGAVTGAAGAAAVGIGKLAMDASDAQNVYAAFESTTKDIGVASDDMLASMKDASAGLLTNVDIMKQVNLANMLVGESFAKDLPSAMEPLRKVSAATGEDMTYLLDSLTRGVGRLSPLILDNLGIQVDLTEAYEEYGRSLGVADSELGEFVKSMSKSDQQAALMTQVMQKLEANTANLPAATDSASVQWQAMMTTIKDLGIEIGQAFLPLLQDLMVVVQEIASRALPVLREWLAKIRTTLEESQPLWDTIVQAWDWAREKATALWQALEPILAPVGEFIAKHVEMKDVLIGVGTAIAVVVVPAVASLAASVLAATWPVLAVIAAVALLREAWESDFLGMRTALTNAWTQIQPIFELVRQWLGENIPPILQTLGETWGTVTTAITDAWQNVFLPALQAVWGFIQEYIVPLFEALLNVWLSSMKLEIEILAGVWQNILLPALREVWAYIDQNVLPILKAVWQFVKETVGPALKWFADNILIGALKNGFNGVKSAIQWVIDKANAFANVLKSIQLPEWLQRHSPSPFEQSLMGIRDLMGEITRQELPRFQAELNATGGMGMATGSSSVTTNNRVLAPVVLQGEDVMGADGNVDWDRLAEMLQGRI